MPVNSGQKRIKKNQSNLSGKNNKIQSAESPLSVFQTKIKSLADNSHQVSKQRAIQLMADRYISSQATLQTKPDHENITGNGLPEPLKTGIESLSGVAMDDVKVHYQSEKPAQLQAHAFAQGTDIHLASGQEKHLPHEAWHVVQQKQGRVKPTLQLTNNVKINDEASLEKEADEMGNKARQLKAVDYSGGQQHGYGVKASQKHPYQRVAIIQKRTSVVQQTQAIDDIDYLLRYTTPASLAALANRMTFNPAPAGDAAIFANLNAYRANAQLMSDDFGNVLAFTRNNGYTNYFSDNFDPYVAPLAANKVALQNLRIRNNTAMVDARKNALFAAVAKPIYIQQAKAYNGNAYRDAITLANAQLALGAWETRFFTLSRGQFIQAAKRRAVNGAPGNATVWNGLSGAIGGYQTHMTIYNNDIDNIADFLVTAATMRADSDQRANMVLADGHGQMGIHLTAEINPAGHLNPRVFGNPADAARHSNYILPPPIVWGNFVAPLNTAEGEVRNDVWLLVNQKKNARP
ncbi:MAG: DUF4157 domain-containing protein [Cyclobacteriaceae bacterium]